MKTVMGKHDLGKGELIEYTLKKFTPGSCLLTPFSKAKSKSVLEGGSEWYISVSTEILRIWEIYETF